MHLSKNVAAPIFSVKDVFGRMIDLNDYRDKKILIGFFRHAGCPFCNLRVHTLMKIHETLREKNMEMIFFFESTERVIRRSTFHQEVSPVPIISDPEKKWYSVYGLENSLTKSIISHIGTFVQTTIRAKQAGVPVHLMASGESFSTMPAEFLIDRGLVVKRLHYAERLNDRMEISDILAFAQT